MTCLSLAYGLSRKIGKRLRDDGSLVGSALKKGRANGEFRGAKSFGLLVFENMVISFIPILLMVRII